MKTLSWFQSNIGKTIYRDHSCNCADCLRIEREGLKIYSKEHAQYLFDVQNDYASEGEILNYRETPFLIGFLNHFEYDIRAL